MAGPYENGPQRVGTAPWVDAQGAPPIRPPAGMLRTLSVQPWDVNPIPTATNFFLQQQANLVLGPNAGDTVLGTIAGGGALQIGRNNIVSIQAVSMFCDSPTLTTSIIYTMRANKVPIPGLTNLKFPPQVAAFLNFPIPGPFNVLSTGAYLDFLITRVVTDVAKQVNFTALGWFCSPQDVQRWTGQVPGQVG